MGWNSWDCFGVEVTEDQVMATADYMAEHLLEFGWEFVVIDAGWYYHSEVTAISDYEKPQQYIDAYGRLIPDTVKYPSAAAGEGFKPLADYVHSKGLKFGIHIMRGIPWKAAEMNTPILGSDSTADHVEDYQNLCEWSNAMVGLKWDLQASQEYYNSIFKLYADWGVDYIKVDDVSREFQDWDMRAIARAIQLSGRPMVLSVSPGPSPLEEADFFLEQTNLFRISNDFWDHWKFIPRQMDYCMEWYPHITPGHWPDVDMLPFGKLRITGGDEWVASLLEDDFENIANEYSRFTDPEKQTIMTLCIIFRSPLMYGGYLPENDDFSTLLITNPEAIDINQHSEANRLLYQDNEVYVWMAEDPDSEAVYLALFNLSEEDQMVEVQPDSLGILQNYLVRNIWDRSDEGVYASDLTFSHRLDPHASLLFKLVPTDSLANISSGADDPAFQTGGWDYWYSGQRTGGIESNDSLHWDGHWKSDPSGKEIPAAGDRLGGFWTLQDGSSLLRIQDVGQPSLLDSLSGDSWQVATSIPHSHDPLDDFHIYLRFRLATPATGQEMDSLRRDGEPALSWPEDGLCDRTVLLNLNSDDGLMSYASGILAVEKAREELIIFAPMPESDPVELARMGVTEWCDLKITVQDTFNLSYQVAGSEPTLVEGGTPVESFLQGSYLSLGTGVGEEALALDIDFIAYRTPEIEAPDREAPQPPDLMRAKQLDPAKTDVKISWSPATDNVKVVRFMLVMGSDTIWVRGNSHVFTDLEVGVEYTFILYALDEAGNISEPISISFTPTSNVGMEDPVLDKVNVFPVPAQSTLNFSQLEGIRTISLLDLDGRILSEIFQLDYYRNGKLQYLFNTENKLWVIDRNGNPVEKFPIE
jgi:hypothetical protein